jgi:hypothetical protein
MLEQLVISKLDEIIRRLTRIETLVKLQGDNMSQLDDAITALTAQVAAEATVDASAVALLNGIPTLIANAVAQATAAGATPAQLAAIANLGTALQAAQAPLAAAVAANTPAAPAPAPAPTT